MLPPWAEGANTTGSSVTHVERLAGEGVTDFESRAEGEVAEAVLP